MHRRASVALRHALRRLEEPAPTRPLQLLLPVAPPLLHASMRRGALPLIRNRALLCCCSRQQQQQLTYATAAHRRKHVRVMPVAPRDATHTRADLAALSKDQLIELLLQKPGPASTATAAATKRPAAGNAGLPAAKRPKEKDASGLSRRGKGKGGSKKPFQMERFAQRHVMLKVCYYGHAYHGFASQVATGAARCHSVPASGPRSTGTQGGGRAPAAS